MFAIARSSDVRLERRWHFFLCTAIGGLGGFVLPMVSTSTTASILCLGMISISYFGAAAIIWSIPPAYLNDEAAAAGIGAISSLGQIGAFCGPLALGWIKTLTGSLSIGLSSIAAIVVLGGFAVLIGVPANTLREKAQELG